MKLSSVGYWTLAATFLLPAFAPAAETAQARLWCWSLHFRQGVDSFSDTLDLTTVSGTPNGELAPYNGAQYVSGFLLDSSGFPITGTLYLNVPPPTDNDNDGWPDFFQVSQGVGAVTSGTYTTAISTGNITANWGRAAGSKDGTCVLGLIDNVYGDLGQFRHTFELLEYTGPLTFTPGTNMVNGTLNLTNSGDSSRLLQGPLQFIKVTTNRFNQLTLQAGTWTNEFSLPLSFTDSLILRDQTSWPTNYYGFIDFADGDPTTPAPDYLSWMLSIDDVNDANHDGIPDFSDDPQSTPPPRSPLLSLSPTATNLLLTIYGDAGTSCQIQQSSSLSVPNWQPLQTVLLTNDPQVVSLPLPIGTQTFWRVQAQ